MRKLLIGLGVAGAIAVAALVVELVALLFGQGLLVGPQPEPSPPVGPTTAIASASDSISRSPSGSPSSPSNQPSSESPSASVVTPIPDGAFDCAALARDAEIRSCGVIHIPLYGDVNLDSKEAGAWGLDDEGTSSSLRYEGTSFEGNVEGHEGVSAVSGADVTYATCADPTRDWVYDLEVENQDKGWTFCNKTPLGRVAAVRLVKDWQSSDYIDITIVVWEAKAS